MTERIFDIIKDPKIIDKEKTREQITKTFTEIHSMIDQLDKRLNIFVQGDKMSLQLSDMKDCMIYIMKHLDEEFDDEK
jgi:hypothetical protein